MTTAEDASRPMGDEPFDPEVAERFRQLERLDPPALDLRAAARPVSLAQRRSTGSGRGRALAVAAALVVIGATSAAVYLSSGGRSSGVETIEAATVDDTGADGGAEADDTPTTTLVVTGGQDGAAGESPSSDAASGGADGAGPSETTASTETTVATPPATEDTSSPTTASTVVSLIPTDDTIRTIAGELTEVFTDCASHLVMAPGGQIRSIGEISCDGGSWIKVDGQMIRTSSGFTSSDQAYDRHVAGLQPGQQVTVVAIAAGGRGTLSLDCPACGIVEVAGTPTGGTGTGGTGGDSPIDDTGVDKDDLRQLGGPGGRADE